MWAITSVYQPIFSISNCENTYDKQTNIALFLNASLCNSIRTVKTRFFEQNISRFLEYLLRLNLNIIWQCSIFFLPYSCWLRGQTKPITIIIIVYTSCHAASKIPRRAHIRTWLLSI